LSWLIDLVRNECGFCGFVRCCSACHDDDIVNAYHVYDDDGGLRRILYVCDACMRKHERNTGNAYLFLIEYANQTDPTV
jgi:hypothetical protein